MPSRKQPIVIRPDLTPCQTLTVKDLGVQDEVWYHIYGTQVTPRLGFGVLTANPDTLGFLAFKHCVASEPTPTLIRPEFINRMSRRGARIWHITVEHTNDNFTPKDGGVHEVYLATAPDIRLQAGTMRMVRDRAYGAAPGAEYQEWNGVDFKTVGRTFNKVWNDRE